MEGEYTHDETIFRTNLRHMDVPDDVIDTVLDNIRDIHGVNLQTSAMAVGTVYGALFSKGIVFVPVFGKACAMAANGNYGRFNVESLVKAYGDAKRQAEVEREADAGQLRQRCQELQAQLEEMIGTTIPVEFIMQHCDGEPERNYGKVMKAWKSNPTSSSEDTMVRELLTQAASMYPGINEATVRDVVYKSGLSSMPIEEARKRYIDVLMSMRGL